METEQSIFHEKSLNRSHRNNRNYLSFWTCLKRCCNRSVKCCSVYLVLLIWFPDQRRDSSWKPKKKSIKNILFMKTLKFMRQQWMSVLLQILTDTFRLEQICRIIFSSLINKMCCKWFQAQNSVINTISLFGHWIFAEKIMFSESGGKRLCYCEMCVTCMFGSRGCQI